VAKKNRKIVRIVTAILQKKLLRIKMEIKHGKDNTKITFNPHPIIHFAEKNGIKGLRK
jgi:hypothetical protein